MSISLVGIDIESGGLDGYIEIDGQRVHGAAYYPILEIGVLVATSDLQKADAFSVGIRQSQESLDKMDPWAKEQHEKSGLLEVLAEGGGHNYLADSVEDAAAYIIQRLESVGAMPYDRKERTGSIVFGNSVGFDMNFIGAQMPELANHFHYRKIDISAIALLERTAWNWVGFNPPEKQYGHTALADIQESFDELKSYTKTLQTMIENMKL
ncbi:oligoribonuclease [Alcanivorax nanhaiticus]|uniref:Oligoribonuclease n=1 Tax=Alcanivorax nanhaiticus TaxID=1177154 RepID=A0A095UGS1_9GAMM|nr:oligoribonuclease [Alcanivorax nanhaiticus]KGD61680.1 oligoribonuclease [Alcanivorax nanhaiticus]MAG53729.1 oligoribonuclease [Halomonas sp.]OUW29526.1 MAG: hypothetical protein CBD27_02875 [Rhodospirillaceae bacterium TMED167]|tara:strand:+ start:3435 stop:4064 length:630 start_codon:yes stop_codon:yes gene_type:complete